MAEKPNTNPIQDTSEGLLAQLDKLAAAGTQQGDNEKQKQETEVKDTDTDKPTADPAADAAGASKPAEKGGDTNSNADNADAPPKGLSEKGKVDWKALRKKADDFEAKVKALEADLAAARATATPPEEIESLKAKLKEYEDQLIVTNLEQHPEFKRYFDGKAGRLLETAKTIGGEKMAHILQLPEGEYRKAALKEAFLELDPVDQSRLGAVLNDFSNLNAERAAELAKSREGLTALQQREQQQRKAQAEAANRVLDEALERWSSDKGNPLFQKREGDSKEVKEWNDAVEARKAQAKRIYNGGLSIQDTAKASMWAAAAPAMAEHINGLSKSLADARAEIEKLKAAKPGAGGNGNSSPVVEKFTTGSSYIDAAIGGWEGSR